MFLSLPQSDIISLLPTVKFVKMTSTKLNTDALNVFVIYCLAAFTKIILFLNFYYATLEAFHQHSGLCLSYEPRTYARGSRNEKQIPAVLIKIRLQPT